MARRGILLDLDGTVWDGWAFYARLIDEHGAGEGDALREIRDGAAAAKLLDRAGIRRAAFAAECRVKPAELYPGIAMALGRARRDGVRLAAVTNLPKWMCEPLLAAHALPIETAVTWGDAARRKPHPDPLVLALERLSLEPGEVHWYVGDDAKDASAAKAAGLRFAWASWGYTDAPPDGTDRALKAPEEIAELR